MQTLPPEIRRGMKVFDRTRKQIGRIDDFRFSENEDWPDVEPSDLDASDRRRGTSGVDKLSEVFGVERLPQEFRERLLREGYIRVDTAGLFSADRYILPEQIASATKDAVTLNVSEDELIRRH
jgi:hypothetical protein